MRHMETKKKIERVNHKLAIEYKKAVKALNPDDDGDTNDPVMILDESEIEENGEICSSEAGVYNIQWDPTCNCTFVHCNQQ